MIYTLIGAIVISTISLRRILCRNKKKPLLNSWCVNKVLAMVSILIVILYTATAIMAYTHGADLESLQRFSVLRTIQAIQKSPISDKSSGLDQRGNILLYYRFGCKDCEAVYNSLRAETMGKENIYWVASRQAEGQKLLRKYAVAEVPAGVIIQSGEMYVSYVLCESVYGESDETGRVQLDIHALYRLFALQEREKRL